MASHNGLPWQPDLPIVHLKDVLLWSWPAGTLDSQLFGPDSEGTIGAGDECADLSSVRLETVLVGGGTMLRTSLGRFWKKK